MALEISHANAVDDVPQESLQFGDICSADFACLSTLQTATSDLGDSVGLASPHSDDNLSICSSGVNMSPRPSDLQLQPITDQWVRQLGDGPLNHVTTAVPQLSQAYSPVAQFIAQQYAVNNAPVFIYDSRFGLIPHQPQEPPAVPYDPEHPQQEVLTQAMPAEGSTLLDAQKEVNRHALVMMHPDHTILFARAPGTTATPPVAATSPYPSAVTMKMEIVWHTEFLRNFSSFMPHHWQLQPVESPPAAHTLRWRTFKDAAKVRFHCDRCSNGWTSMKGRVMFWINLDGADNLGGVLFKLYGQACQKCYKDEEVSFCHAMWYPEEVIKVIGNLYNRVGQLYYGFSCPPIRIDRRQGRPKERHCAAFCQACQEGVCKFEWTFN